MKVVINKCWGGFGISPLAVKCLADLDGRPCFFFRNPRAPRLDFEKYESLTLSEAQEETSIVYAFDIPNPNEVLKSKDWHTMSQAERQAHNALYAKHSREAGGELDRSAPNLIRIVEELGDDANGHHAKLCVVEIPDGVDWEIDEYDGMERIAEKHRTWA